MMYDDASYGVLLLCFNRKLRAVEEERLMDAGALALTEHPDKPHHYIITLDLGDQAAFESVCQSVQGYEGWEAMPEAMRATYTPEPIQVAEDLWVLDPSLAAPKEGSVIRIEAGEAFGTGHHPSTQLLLRWLHQHAYQGKSFCDVGCGSGILGVYAKMRGAGRVLGVDIDPEALRSTLHHARLNHVEVEVSDRMPEASFDLVISNCEYKVLLALQESIIQALMPGGYWIITGIISRVWPQLHKTLPDWPLVFHAKQGAWVLKGLQKPL